MQIIPAVDVLDGQVVRLRKGRFDDVTAYDADPVVRVKRWAGEGAELVHVVDLSGARTGEPDHALWERLGSTGCAYEIGGGIRDAAAASAALEAGAARVVMGSAAVWNPETVREVVGGYGADRVVAALDVRSGRAVGSGWEDAGRPIGEAVRAVAGVGVSWILVTGVERDGMLAGPDLDLMLRLRVMGPELRWIVSGGVGDLDDIRATAAAGFEAVIVGKALYEGRFSLAQALAAAVAG